MRKTTNSCSSKANRKKKVPVSLKLEYRLSELPSAQHRAGLAGLVLLVQWIERRARMKGVCKITQWDQSGADIELDRIGLGTLLDELFNASWQTRKSDKEVRDAVPSGAFLAEYDPSEKEQLWLSLWQETVLTILRNKAKNRLPFVARAEGRETKEAAKCWGSLLTNSTVELSGTFLLGARARNADQTPFLTTARLKFLLYFWPLVMGSYRLAFVNREDELRLSSYLVVIPDVANLLVFCQIFPDILNARDKGKTGTNLPKASLVCMPAEASLETLSSVTEHLPLLSSHLSLKQAIWGVEVVQVDRSKHDIIIQDFRRVTATTTLLDEYAQVRETTRNRMFRQQQIVNLMEGHPAWFGFTALIGTQPREKTIESYSFREDCRSFYHQSIEEKVAMLPSKKSVQGAPDAVKETAPRKAPESIEEAVYEIVHTYLNRKIAIKEKFNWGEIKNDAKKRAEYGEKIRALARATFFTARSRSGEDFVEFFTTTLCSVSQQMSEQGFLRIAQSLYKEPEKVRTLTLLALSAQA